MKTAKLKTKTLFTLQVSVLVLLLATLTVPGQNPGPANQKTPASLSGKYEGTAKDPTGEAKATLELVDEAGKFSGTLTTPLGTFKLAKGQMVEGLLSFEVETKGAPGNLALRQKDDKLVGTFTDAGKTGAIELRRVTTDAVSGVWDAAADAQGQAFPFTLTLKLEGEKVTGGSSSQLGESTISSGVWKDGKLALVLDGANGQVTLLGTLVDGQFVGDYDYSGQLQGRWVGTKKKP
jgi:hypothetical protein